MMGLRERTEAEFRDLLVQAGLRLTGAPFLWRASQGVMEVEPDIGS